MPAGSLDQARVCSPGIDRPAGCCYKGTRPKRASEETFNVAWLLAGVTAWLAVNVALPPLQLIAPALPPATNNVGSVTGIGLELLTQPLASLTVTV